MGFLNTDIDTGGYLFHNLVRTVGYQAFLETLNWLGVLSFVSNIQLNLLLVSFLWLSFGVYKCFKNIFISGAIFIISSLNSSLLALCYMVMPEALFMAILCFTVGGILWLIASPGVALVKFIAIFTAILILIRPVGIFMVFPVGTTLLYVTTFSRKYLLNFLFIFFAILMSACIWNWQKFGIFANSSVGGIALAGQVAEIIASDSKSALDRRVAIEVKEIVGPLKRTSDLYQYQKLSTQIYDEVLWLHIYPQIVYELWRETPLLFLDREYEHGVIDAVNNRLTDPQVQKGLSQFYPELVSMTTSPNSSNLIVYLLTPYIRGKVDVKNDVYDLSPEQLNAVNSVAYRIAIRAIIAHPFQYFYRVMSQIYGAWSNLFIFVNWSVIPYEMERTNKLASQMPDSRLGIEISKFTYSQSEINSANLRSQSLFFPLDRIWALLGPNTKYLQVIAFGISIVSFIGLFLSSQNQRSLGLLSLIIWTYFLLIALLVPAHHRYVIIIEPIVITQLIVFLSLALNRLLSIIK
jgi:hypothetical protein